jgi:hypothetical protein
MWHWNTSLPLSVSLSLSVPPYLCPSLSLSLSLTFSLCLSKNCLWKYFLVKSQWEGILWPPLLKPRGGRAPLAPPIPTPMQRNNRPASFHCAGGKKWQPLHSSLSTPKQKMKSEGKLTLPQQNCTNRGKENCLLAQTFCLLSQWHIDWLVTDWFISLFFIETVLTMKTFSAIFHQPFLFNKIKFYTLNININDTNSFCEFYLKMSYFNYFFSFPWYTSHGFPGKSEQYLIKSTTV